MSSDVTTRVKLPDGASSVARLIIRSVIPDVTHRTGASRRLSQCSSHSAGIVARCEYSD